MGVQNMLQFNILVILVSWPSHHPIFDCLQYAKMEGEGLEIAIEQVETEEDLLSQAAFNQLDDNLK